MLVSSPPDDPDHIAPAFIERKIEFGVITQSAVAFSTLVAAFSLIVTQFQSLSSYAAVVARLSALVEAVGQSGDPGTEPAPQGARPFDSSRKPE